MTKQQQRSKRNAAASEASSDKLGGKITVTSQMSAITSHIRKNRMIRSNIRNFAVPPSYANDNVVGFFVSPCADTPYFVANPTVGRAVECVTTRSCKVVAIVVVVSLRQHHQPRRRRKITAEKADTSKKPVHIELVMMVQPKRKNAIHLSSLPSRHTSSPHCVASLSLSTKRNNTPVNRAPSECVNVCVCECVASVRS